jgi:hypothetical protein
MKKMIVCVASCLVFQYLISMQPQTYNIIPVNGEAYRIPVDTGKGLRLMATYLSKENPLSSYDVLPSALMEYFFSDANPVDSVGKKYVEETLQSDWNKSNFCSSRRYNKIVEQVVEQIQQGEQSALHDCLHTLYRLPVVKGQTLQEEIDAIKPDYQQKIKTYRCQVGCNALLGLILVVAAVGIGLEIWTVTLYCHS